MFLLRRKLPFLLVGWLWYVVMLLPVIGIIQVGLQARADRYTYLPQIGVLLAVVWAIRDLTSLWRGRTVVLVPDVAGSSRIPELSKLSPGYSLARHRITLELYASSFARKRRGTYRISHGRSGAWPDGRCNTHFRHALGLRKGNAAAHYGLGLLCRSNAKPMKRSTIGREP